MRIGTAPGPLMLTALALLLQGCLGSGPPTSATQPLPLLSLSNDASGADANAGLSPEQARAQAVAEIRAKAQAHHAQHESASYPPVFAAQGPPMSITSQSMPQAQIESELTSVRRELEDASDPEEVAALEERMAELIELGRTHAQRSEEEIEANSRATR